MAQENTESGRLSRRGFLKGVGGGLLGGATLAGGLLAGESQAGQPEVEVVQGRTSILLQVNGQAHSVEVEPRTTLLSALRNQLGLTGAKEVCDRGQCGGCTVLLDGQAVLACMMLALDARGRQIVTVEGLARGDELSAVQQAFVERDGQMCGFCTPGMVIAATALLQRHPTPTPEQIREGMSGNLCRCGAYPGIFAAVQQAAGQRPQEG